MKRIEPLEPAAADATASKIRDFWTRNVNSENLFGKAVTTHDRGDADYFIEIEQQRYRSHRHLLPWIRQMQPGRSVLEIGCGIGLDTYKMAQQGLNVTAVDLTDVAVNTARQRFEREGLKARFLTADATALPFPDSSFDYVYSFGVLHHVQDTVGAIAQVHRVLKPGGEALIMLYNRHSLNELVHRIAGVPFEEKEELCPVVRRFTPGEARVLFSDFSDVLLTLDFAFGEGYGAVFRRTPLWIYKALSRHLGWHIMIKAKK
jgi:ubiquinone/menaquinone biosynthesis C-methylase UbiE